MSRKVDMWKALFYPFLLSFLLDSVFVMNFTYADALFLSSYPKEWLTYYFLADPLLIIFIFFLANPFLSKASVKQIFVFILIMIIGLSIMERLLTTKIYYIPFILSLLLSGWTRLLYSIGWNTLASGFDIRAFKEYAFYLTIAGSVSSILTAFTIPLMVYLFDNPFVFYTSIVATIGTAICILKLKPISTPVKKQELIQTNLYKHHFFRYVFIYTILSVAIISLAHFAFQQALMGNYSQEGLATFISIFFGAMTVIGLLAQLFLANRLLTWLGLAILIIAPLAAILLGSMMAVWPVFIVFIAFNGIATILDDSFVSPCREIIINPYPSQLRRKANMFLRGYAVPVGGLLCAGIVMIVNNYLSLYFLGITVFSIGLVWAWVALKTRKGYQETLHESLKENHFNPDLLPITAATALYMREDILRNLQSDNPHAIRVGLAFYSKTEVANQVKDKVIQDAITHALTHSEKDIRYKAAIALKEMKAHHAKSKLLNQLLTETDEEVQWAILETLIELGCFPEAQEAEAFLSNKDLILRAYGLVTLNLKYKKAINNQLLEISQGSEEDKILLARIIKFLPLEAVSEKIIQTLLHDKNEQVSIHAINSIRPNASLSFVPILVEFLKEPRKSYYAEKALVTYGTRITDRLLQITTTSTSRQLMGVLRLLVQIEDLIVLEKLLSLSQEGPINLRVSIAGLILNYQRVCINNETMRELIIVHLTWLAQEIAHLSKLEDSDNSGVQLEIRLQLRFNRIAFLLWYSCITHKHKVASVARYIEKPQNYENSEVAKAYEFLEALAFNKPLREIIQKISITYNRELPPAESHYASIQFLATHPIVHQEGKPMDLLDKTAFLRRIKLFEDIPLESLKAIAEVAQETDMSKNQYIFHDGDEPDRFYCIVSGEITIKNGAHILGELKENDYFGELGLLDNSPRTADAIAVTDGLLLYIEKDDFLHVLEDLPEIMRAVVSQVVKYLRRNLSLTKNA